jgi:hypothetical protein
MEFILRVPGKNIKFIVFQAFVDDSGNTRLVKFGPSAKITDLERKTILLERQEEALKKQLHKLEVEQTNRVKDAKDYLSKGMRAQVRYFTIRTILYSNLRVGNSNIKFVAYFFCKNFFAVYFVHIILVFSIFVKIS